MLKDFTYKKILEKLKPKTQNVLKSILNVKPKAQGPPKKKNNPVNQNEAVRKAMAFLASKKKAPEKKAPLKKPGLTKTKPIPLTKGSPKKNNGTNKR